MQKDFDTWNKIKKKINTIETELPFYTGQIWWCSVRLNVGHEIDGKHNTFERPFYIFKKCNADMFIGIPCTSNYKDRAFMYKLRTPRVKFVLNFSQIKTMSSKRLLRRIVNISTFFQEDIKKNFFNYINR